ncbi:uncharacterized protein [Choristoneura fumiferana]|uniref:uncharacterized protein n=1 Tax=Choristoneura fumiferana TaxID=7141 RepID=UPI003D15B23D
MVWAKFTEPHWVTGVPAAAVAVANLRAAGPPPQPPPAPLVTDSAAPPVVPTPSTSADCTPLLTDPAAPTDPSVLDTEVLDNELLEILGMDPTSVKTYGKDIQKDLSVRLEHYTTSGLSKELRKELKEKYLTPGNCKKIDPPELNAEIKAAITEVVEKRDKAIESKQRHLTTAITCVGAAITELLSSKEKHPNLLRSLMDAVRIMCDCQHADSVTRRKFLLNSVKKDMKEQLQNTKIDRFLFGENLSDTLKSAKAIVRSGSDLKQPAFKPQNKRTAPNSSNSLPKNWKGQSQGRRPPIPSKTKEPTATTTRGRPNTYSKQSHHPQQKSNYNRR